MPTYDVKTVAAPMPNLENLKKQAKQYLRWHRERYQLVARQLGFEGWQALKAGAVAMSNAEQQA